MNIQKIEQAIKDIAEGKIIIILNMELTPSKACFAVSAEKINTDSLKNIQNFSNKKIQLALDPANFARLGLNHQPNNDSLSMNAIQGIASGSEPSDMVQTIHSACKTYSTQKDFSSPGSIFPLQSNKGGILVRAGMAEAIVDLTKLADITAAGVLCEYEIDTEEKFASLAKIGTDLNIHTYHLHEIMEYKLKNEPVVNIVNTVDFPTDYGNFLLHTFQTSFKKSRNADLALTIGLDKIEKDEIPLVRVHGEWSIVNILNRLSHKDGSHLNDAMRAISEHGCGVLLFLRNTPEPGSQTSIFKQAAIPTDLWIEEQYVKTLAPTEANMTYGLGAQMLRKLGVTKMKLLSNKPTSFKGIANFGLEVIDKQRF